MNNTSVFRKGFEFDVLATGVGQASVVVSSLDREHGHMYGDAPTSTGRMHGTVLKFPL